MTMDHTPPDPDVNRISIDEFLRDVLPDLKLALGEQIDRENTRSLPGRYARLLPETLLVATLRADAAQAIAPIASQLERELTNSCSRHGSLYDRTYRVELRRAAAGEAPLYSVAAHAGQPSRAASPTDVQPPAADPATVAPAQQPSAAEAPAERPVELPAEDPDATRVDGVPPHPGWQAGRWLLVVETLDGVEVEVFRLVDPLTTVGRRSEDPRLDVNVALRDVPHVSRRQLALLWTGAEDAPGFRIYNLGLNPLHLGDREIAGARVGRGIPDLDALDARSTADIRPEEPIRIGEQGPVILVREVPAEDEDDPEATRFE
jgi:hypothetical protein